MLKVAILDDYQNVSHEFVDLKKLSGKYEIKVFSEPFIDENDAIEQLNDFEALLIMRERTIISEKLISANFSFFGKFKTLQNLPIFEKFSLNFAQSLMKFCRNFANIFENVEKS